jgi:hypothetical protein
MALTTNDLKTVFSKIDEVTNAQADRIEKFAKSAPQELKEELAASVVTLREIGKVDGAGTINTGDNSHPPLRLGTATVNEDPLAVKDEAPVHEPAKESAPKDAVKETKPTKHTTHKK